MLLKNECLQVYSNSMESVFNATTAHLNETELRVYHNSAKNKSITQVCYENLFNFFKILSKRHFSLGCALLCIFLSISSKYLFLKLHKTVQNFNIYNEFHYISRNSNVEFLCNFVKLLKLNVRGMPAVLFLF